MNSKNRHSKENFAFSQSKDLLIPWKNVIDNAVFSLELSGVKKEKSYPVAKKLMSDFFLKGSEFKYPHQLSKGMRQRVSLIRSFLTGRPILLLDEPFSPLDSITRDDLQDWLIDILKKHISNFWTPPIGADGAENLIVDIFMEFNKEGYVLKAEWVNRGMNSNNSFYKAAANAAIRAVKDAEPMPLPVSKFKEWRTLTFRFDPATMFGGY